MLHITSSTRIPSVDETLGILKMHNDFMPQFVDFDKVMMDINYLQIQIEKVAGPLFDIIGKPKGVDAAENMKNWLSNNVDISVFNFAKTGLSLDKASIEAALDSGTLNDDAQILLKMYQKYASFAKTRGTLVSLLQNPISNAPSCDGHRMLILKPEWTRQNTGRVAMNSPAVQNFPRLIQEIITVPQGYTLLHTDSGQIEPRVVYSAYIKDPQIQALIRLYNDAYFGVLHYIFLPQEVVDSGTTSFAANEITDEMKENRKQLKTFNNAVMYGSKSNPTGNRIKAAMIKRIGEHPLRLAWINSLTEQINQGNTVFHTAFGTPINTAYSAKIMEGNLRAGSVEEERLRLAINNPIQGTAADLMRVSVSEANRILSSRTKKSYIINYVHDAGMFAIADEDYDKVADELADIVSYDVEGWLPISAEPEFGRDHGKAGLIEDLY
jgi:DNA polymerase-1